MDDLRQVVNVQLPTEEGNGKPHLKRFISSPCPKTTKSEMISRLDLPPGTASIIIIVIISSSSGLEVLYITLFDEVSIKLG